MSPQAIFLYEIDESFGPNMLAEYNLSQQKIPPEVLKDFTEKHVTKEFNEASTQKNNVRYYSGVIRGESLEKKNLYLGFALKEDENVISIKSAFETIQERVVKNYSKDNKMMDSVLKDALNSILTLMDKLKEPKIIIETINEKTKEMLDNGKIPEARELINLGEDIPDKLAEEIKIAEQSLEDKLYKKAKKSYLKAAELAEIIQEFEIVSFLMHKAEVVGTFPDLSKERERIISEVEKAITELQTNQLHLYHEMIKPINRLVEISSAFEDNELITKLLDLYSNSTRADKLAKELFNLDKKIKENFESI
ncbi:MAG: hypothetical protein KGD73_09555 [Candidatus Lokiarchaeota archaeon]|nr:hypothetical protein [Candidatus Lokiarchaeota archaeon]